MKKNSLLICLFFLSTGSKAQIKKIERLSHTVALDIHIPVGDFASSHFLGTGARYGWAKQQFGSTSQRISKPFGFTAQLGVDQYFGKKDEYGFRFFGLTYLEILGGILYQPCKKGNIVFATGPALSIYHGNTLMGLSARFSGDYYFKKNMAITPSIRYIKHNDEHARWIVGIGAGYSF